jgi:hypothetical protein
MTRTLPPPPPNICDVCHGESKGAVYVGVAAVPAAPMSVAWCQNCLHVNAIPRHVAEYWLFAEFDKQQYPDGPVMRKKPPRHFPLADWAGEFKIWLGPVAEYAKLKDCYKTLWKHEYERQGGDA